MFFDRGSYDPNARAEAQTRLQSFQGATSISSSQYFGRGEDEEATSFASSSAAAGSGSGYLSEEALQNLGTSAREAVQRVLANPDVQSIGESLRTGALKVRRCVLFYGIG
jgi:ADP-ribosylation factor GTPase-activating protein 2/3